MQMNDQSPALADFLWIPLILFMLLPVVIHSCGEHDVHTALEQGPLLMGRAALDSLLDASRGRVIIVNFWATWCTPCVAELSSIDAVSSAMSDSVVAVAVDLGDPDPGTLLSFRDKIEFALVMVWLSEEEATALKEDMALPDLLPTTVFFDAEGSEYLRISGSREASFFESAIRSGASGVRPPGDEPYGELHINVVGYIGDTLTVDLLEYSIELAGTAGVDFFDPGDSDDLEEIRALYLPESGYPYAQPCRGTACGRPASTREGLLSSAEQLDH
jgi:thiol-disulfide isomerase/thioredoxin